MTNFEEYLISIGYEGFIMSRKLKLVRPKTNFNYSSMVDMNMIRQIYIQDREIIKQIDSEVLPKTEGTYSIIYGLHEVGKGPTLIHPRPKIKITIKDEDTKEIIGYGSYNSDDYMNRILQQYSPEFIYESLFNSYVYEFEEMRKMN